MVSYGQTEKIVFIIIAIVVITGLIQFVFVMNTPRVVEEQVFKTKAEIGIPAGFAVDERVANFGRIPPGGASQKEFEIGNSHNEQVIVIAKVYGNISDMIQIVPNYVTLEPKEKVTLVAQFTAGNNSIGNYTGYIHVQLAS